MGSHSRGSAPLWAANWVESRGPSTSGLVHLRSNRPRDFDDTRNGHLRPCSRVMRLVFVGSGFSIYGHRLPISMPLFCLAPCIPSLSIVPTYVTGSNGTFSYPSSSSLRASIHGSTLPLCTGSATSQWTSPFCPPVGHQITVNKSRHNVEQYRRPSLVTHLA